MTQGYMGNIGGSGSTSAQGGGVPVAQPRRTKPEINYPKKKVSARMVLWLTAVTIAFAVAVVTGITVYHITQEDMRCLIRWGTKIRKRTMDRNCSKRAGI